MVLSKLVILRRNRAHLACALDITLKLRYSWRIANISVPAAIIYHPRRMYRVLVAAPHTASVSTYTLYLIPRL